MPYNTRRKSLSLPSLGIHVPVTHAERAAAAAAAAASRHDSRARSNSSVNENRDNLQESADSQPHKKVKRSHTSDDLSRSRSRIIPTPSSPRSALVPGLNHDRTPPPSPECDRLSDDEDARFDDASRRLPVVALEGINDDIVEAVIERLQNTRNRPHLVKELAAVLSQKLPVVQNSANQCAIISSRLSTYLKRTCWSAIAPCPLAKELETVHPRRTYFFLTTYPRQPLPDQLPAHISPRAFISPSISSAESGSDESENDRRRELSPSPEIDLSSPELDEGDDDVAMPSTPIGSLPARSTFIRGHRNASPPLEKDEREFTQTADGLQKRKLGRELLVAEPSDHSMDIDDASRDDIWFGEPKPLTAGILAPPMAFVSSPAIRPSFPGSGNRKDVEPESWLRAGRLLDWDVSPEAIELEELDCLLEAC